MNLLILTPTLGRSSHLEATVKSVAALPCPARHVLVCPPPVGPELLRRFPRCEILHESSGGVYGALNDGLRSSDWDVFTWINDDDLLQASSPYWQSAPAAAGRGAIAYGKVDYFDARDQPLGPLPVCRNPGDLRAAFSAGIPGLTQHGTLIPRAVVERIGLFETAFRLGADFDFFARAIVTGERFQHVPSPCAQYRLHPGQLSSDVTGIAQEIEASRGRHFGPISNLRRRWLKLRFHVAHTGDLLLRLRKAGCLRSSTLYRRAAAG